MEEDRYEHNSKLFITCMICLMTSLTLFAFSLYLLPYLVWGWIYNVPGFILMWREWFISNYAYSQSGAGMALFLLFFVPALITGFISWLTSNKIENEVLGLVSEKYSYKKEDSHELRDTFSMTLKLIIMLVLVFAGLFFVEWLLAVPTPPEELI